MRGFSRRTDVAEACRLVRESVTRLESEQVALAEAAGRVTAGELAAPVPVPGFPRAAMDGYALRGEETFGASSYAPPTFRLIGEAMPGRPFPRSVASGEAVRIMTGAPLPEGADAVVMAEAARELDGPAGRGVAVVEAVPPGRHVGQVGEDIQAGQQLLPAGRILRPQDVGALASVGLAAVPVVRRPAVRLVITGDELLPPGARPTGPRIVDSNSLMLEALVRRDGGIPLLGPIVPDRRAAVEAALLDPAGDLVLVSGGSSVGTEDHAPLLVAAHGTLLVHGVAMRPASPSGIGRIAGRLVFLLPGNPVSCLCAYDVLAGPAIRILGGRSPDWPHRQRCAPLARKIASAIGRVDYVRVRLTAAGVEPLAVSGAAILSSTIRADGFVIVDRDSEGCAPGTEVRVYLYD
ncbi:MAG: gephyrin-like molybdotransferase Glp [Candidatus Methylomirabilota bacterium]